MVATPTFFIVGAPKAGTTSLYHYLGQHPAVFMSPIKEPNFFAPEVAAVTKAAGNIVMSDAAATRAHLAEAIREKKARSVVSTWEQYLALFQDVRDETAIGEASVAYLASLAAPAAIRERLPTAKIIMMLRDPVDRLYSYYAARSASGETAARFARWAIERAEHEGERRSATSMIWGGRYARHLRRYRECFAAAQLCVLLYDDFVRSPRPVMRDLLTFLTVDPDVPLDLRRRHNVTLGRRWPLNRAVRAIVPRRVLDRARRVWTPPRSAGVPIGERAAVVELYADDIRDLQTLIQRDLSAWLR